ncbi:MAG: glycosyltransferase family 9 protein [Nanoarchaeota archaeon]|nr:glycosyltransferase family 9 protein [Nanoarchaeota archaeon]
MRICIIKLGADGDVLRTLPLAKALKDKHKDAEITWITKGDVSSLLENIPYIKNVSVIPYFGPDKFDLLYNFDIDNTAISLAEHIRADKKYGFGKDGDYPVALNSGASYYLNTLFDDELKKSNEKTYQEMMFMAAELNYKKEKYNLILDEKDKEYAEKFKDKNNFDKKKIIGIHMGASSRWPSKVWAENKVVEFIRMANKIDYQILLFGGPNEVDKHDLFSNKLEKEGIKIFRNNPNNTKREFASLVDLCDVVVCSDSFSLHVSIGLGKKTVCLFLCTGEKEVEGYSILKKVVSPLLKDFFPERMNEYNKELVESISAEEVMKSVKESLI